MDTIKIELRALSENDDIEIYEMIREIGLGENGFTTNLPEGYVFQTIYWMFVDDRPVAYGKLKHQLNERLKEYGGHIGYIVRPTERGKGYGKAFLSELMNVARNIGLDELLITCDETNVRSRKVIESKALS
ncbi:GNAT family N-acetyltransferase [Paenibacillus sanguinis]|uniref:GNAT family N-acetyltransferase n=1 Tax=Paenibacillus sanguinis TaxID=225906 RepID=UPI000374F20D|nr:GNAT family N-acetyltransferase [Paenibacillus sanguinis]